MYAFIDKFLKSAERKKKKSIKIINVIKRYANAEHLVDNLNFAKIFDFKIFKIL